MAKGRAAQSSAPPSDTGGHAGAGSGGGGGELSDGASNGTSPQPEAAVQQVIDFWEKKRAGEQATTNPDRRRSKTEAPAEAEYQAGPCSDIDAVPQWPPTAPRRSFCGSPLCLLVAFLCGAASSLAGAVALISRYSGNEVVTALHTLALQLPEGLSLSMVAACPEPPPAAEGAAGAAGGSACQLQLAQLRVQLEDLADELPKARAAWASERAELEAQCSRTVASVEQPAVAEAPREAPAAASAAGPARAPTPLLGKAQPVTSSSRGSTSWPECVEQNIVLRGHGVHAVVEDLTTLLGDAVRGCWDGNCAATDKFETSRPEDCARVCGALPSCMFWTLGEQDGASQCFLRTSDAGREAVAGFVAGAKACRPLATVVLPAQAALAVLDLPALRACDGGTTGPLCPSLHNAMRTWRFGIENLKLAVDGSTSDVSQYIDQISLDADTFIAADGPADQLEQMYTIAVTNNRQVFQVVRVLLEVGSQEPPSRLDVSVPRPVRGLLCRATCA